MTKLHRIPPAPEVMSSLYEDFLQQGRPIGLSFAQYLDSIHFTNDSAHEPGMDDGVQFVPGRGPDLIRVPRTPIQESLRCKVLLIDFPDLPGSLPRSHYETLLFSKGIHPTGSMRDFFEEVSLGKVDVTGTVEGWLRLPREYTYYTNGSSGTDLDSYPRNARRMAEDAVRAALAEGMTFSQSLDALGNNTVTALFLVHAGVGAEVQQGAAARGDNIWSHKWSIPSPIQVADGLWAGIYLTVPHDARLGVCAHELGHLAFQWEDFYDPNYARDGRAWDGSGDWDLMAGGSYNGNSRKPAHPVAVHKAQHGWIEVSEVRTSKRLRLSPFTKTSGECTKLVSGHYTSSQYLLLENRTRFGFDAHLPGEGLLVWKVDESKEMVAPDAPALQLIEADGRRDLQHVGDANAGDSGDPFPGSSERTQLTDSGTSSTTFPSSDRSGIVLENIVRDADTGDITLDVIFDGVPVDAGVTDPQPPDTMRIQRTAEANLPIPDNDPSGIASAIQVPLSGRLRDLTVGVDIRHTYIGDLRVELVAPSGQSALLHAMTGGSSANLLRTYRAASQPALAALADAAVKGDWKLRVSDLQGADVGRLVRWSLDMEVASSPRRVDETRRPMKSIPDDDPVGISDAIDIGSAGVARSVEVSIDIEHTYRGDLRVELVGPQGEMALLHNRTGGSERDLKRDLDVVNAPDLARFVGAPIQGKWLLRVSDQAGHDVGTLREWRLVMRLAPDVQSLRREERPGAAIPDDDPAGIGRSVTFEEIGVVQSLQLEADLAHTYIGDLRVELIGPSGGRALLHDRTGGRAAGLQLRVDSATSDALAALVGQPVRGNWILRVADLEAADVGTLERWSLRLVYA